MSKYWNQWRYDEIFDVEEDEEDFENENAIVEGLRYELREGEEEFD